MERGGQSQRLDPFSPPPTHGRRPVPEERHVAAEVRREGVEPAGGTSRPHSRFKPSRVAAASDDPPASPACAGMTLDRVILAPRSEPVARLQPLRRPDHQVLGPGGQAGVVAGELDPSRRGRFEGQGVAQVDRHHQRLDVVIAVGPPAQDFQEQVELGGSQHRHATRFGPDDHRAAARGRRAEIGPDPRGVVVCCRPQLIVSSLKRTAQDPSIGAGPGRILSLSCPVAEHYPEPGLAARRKREKASSRKDAGRRRDFVRTSLDRPPRPPSPGSTQAPDGANPPDEANSSASHCRKSVCGRIFPTIPGPPGCPGSTTRQDRVEPSVGATELSDAGRVAAGRARQPPILTVDESSGRGRDGVVARPPSRLGSRWTKRTQPMPRVWPEGRSTNPGARPRSAARLASHRWQTSTAHRHPRHPDSGHPPLSIGHHRYYRFSRKA